MKLYNMWLCPYCRKVRRKLAQLGVEYDKIWVSFHPNRWREVEELTRNNTGTIIIVAADYGGRWDIANALKSIARNVESGEISSDSVDTELVHQYTSIGQYPDPDLCIRTGGEHRISNFLLWQFAYTELYFTDCYWPDFDEEQLQLALDDFASRQRRYGGHDEPQCQDD